MNNIQTLHVFKFDQNYLDYAILNNEPLFNLNNVAEILGLTNPRMSIDTDDEDYVIKLDNSVVGLTYNRNLNNRGELFLTEAGLYKLIMRSNKPSAEAFQKWVVKDVLPSIRKTGGYNMNNKMLSDMYERMMMLQEDMIKLQNRVVDMQYQQLSGKRLAVYSKRMREDIIDCYKNGYSTRVISKMFGISINRVIDILSIELFI